ncbi:class I SAM-dependent methyltransferase [Aspergillus undulatus]|uniref:class I SAM-dependent methyltransferase n=1 Tax=Aspergillus undulatus TaxID=1810928 RepID=UPI003CCCA9FA
MPAPTPTPSSTQTPGPLYDNPTFYKSYHTQAPTSVTEHQTRHTEWHYMISLVGSVVDKNVLDLGCGYGWFSKWAAEQGARNVLGVDNSEFMLKRAGEIISTSARTGWLEGGKVRFEVKDLDLQEEQNFKVGGDGDEGVEDREDVKFDIAYSSLTFHYITHLTPLFKSISSSLSTGGKFIFSIQHPIWTATDNGSWQTLPSTTVTPSPSTTSEKESEFEYWPVRTYSTPGPRWNRWVGDGVKIYHRPMNGYFDALRAAGFELVDVREWVREFGELPGGQPDSGREGHRPAWLILAARKK